MMRRIKIIILTALFLLFIKGLNAQQVPYYTQYMFNDYLINPAVTGTFNYFKIRANSRIQWMGITDSPRTMSISGYGPLKNKPMGYGGYVYNDVTGPESRLSLGGSYAYNIALTDAMRISGGLTIGLMQYKLDGTGMYFNEDINDPAIPQAVEKRIIPDASVGFYLYSSFYYVGLSAHQLIGNKYNTYEESDTLKGISRLSQHVYLTGGYNYILNRDLALLPSLLLKYTRPGQVQAEISVRANYQKMAWFGLSFRTGDAVSILGGYNYENKIIIGLAYDITVSDLRRYSNGTIEVMIGYKFNSIK